MMLFEHYGLCHILTYVTSDLCYHDLWQSLHYIMCYSLCSTLQYYTLSNKQDLSHAVFKHYYLY